MNEQNNKKGKMVKFWKIPMVLIAVFLFSIFDLPSEFYAIMRLVVFTLSIPFAYFYIRCKDEVTFLSGSAIVIAILWNPFLPIYLQKEVWIFLDIFAASLEFCMLESSYALWKETEK